MSLTKVEIEHEGRKYPLFIEGVGAPPLANDIDIAQWLGYDRPRNIRKLIVRLSQTGSLGKVFCSTVEQKGRGRPSVEFFLTEAQALMVAARSDTPRATEVLQTIIDVFLKATRGSPVAPVVNTELAEARSMLGQATAMLSQATALITQALSVPDLIQRTVAAELHKQNCLRGPHADEIRKTIMQHADRMSGGAKHSSTAWRSARSRHESRLREVLNWRGRWERCPHSVGHVENILRAMSPQVDHYARRGELQLKLVPPTPAISMLPKL